MKSANMGNSDAPRIVLEMKNARGSPDVSYTLPFQIYFTIRRLPDSHDESCIFQWSTYSHFSEARFVLFHETDSGSERINIEPPPSRLADSRRDYRDSIEVTTNNQARFDIIELPSEGSGTFMHSLPEYYHRHLVVGEKYRLFWPGSEIKYWGWGSAETHREQGIKLEYRDSSSAIKVPENEGLTFVVTEEKEPWPDRAKVEEEKGLGTANQEEWDWRCHQAQTRRERAEANERPKLPPSDAGAPIITTTLEGPSEVSFGKSFDVKAIFRLENDGPEAKPIIFHTFKLNSGFRVARRVRSSRPGSEEDNGNATWEPWIDDDEDGHFLIVDDPDVYVNVSSHQDFASLQPGESWACEWPLSVETTPGDVFRVWHTGVELDWWDWGSAEDHASTKVGLPCFIGGPVQDPKDNGGRPKLRVSGTDGFEFVLKE